MASKKKTKKESKKNSMKNKKNKKEHNVMPAKKRLKFSNVPLRQRMLEQLKSSRFRYINEEIYNMPGKEALQYFKKDPDAFQAYHSGYQKQLEQWPTDPLNVIIKSLKRELKKSSIIADFGCGEARLAKALPQCKTHSLDLVALDPCVTVCDIAATPLPSESVDVVVCCLSLMGTNLCDYIKEASRILKVGGLLKIAEVASRFEDVNEFVQNLVAFGFKNENVDDSNKVFILFDFRKSSNMSKRSKKRLPAVTLKPCLYKKR